MRILLKEVHVLLISWVTADVINVSLNCVEDAPGVSQAGIFISISHTLKGFPFIQFSSLQGQRLKNPISHFPVYMFLFHGIPLSFCS